MLCNLRRAAQAIGHHGLAQQRGDRWAPGGHRIEARAAQGGLLLFGMAKPAVADQVDQHIGAEAGAVGKSQRGRARELLGGFGIHPQHRGVDAAGHVGAVARGRRVHRVGRRETQLIVQDDMDAAADRVAAALRQHQGLHDDALAGKGRVAMQHQRGGAALLLGGIGHAQHDRVDALQMRRVRCQLQRHRAMLGVNVAPGTEVVDQVIGCQRRCRRRVDMVQDLRWWHAEQVDQQVHASPMGHADEDLGDRVQGRLSRQGVHQRQQGLATFQRKTLGQRKAPRDMPLPDLGLDQAVEQRVIAVRRGQGFEMGVQPVPAIGVAHGAGVQRQPAAVDALECAVQPGHIVCAQ
mmetsp:Transcript_26282/g.62277  ORF Transcript_26282/g.62277 Transcript_26282/m.62277 type:complete len:350 (-) Transcript_26282:796-1845(-)